jgi:hypothetical protein
MAHFAGRDCLGASSLDATRLLAPRGLDKLPAAVAACSQLVLHCLGPSLSAASMAPRLATFAAVWPCCCTRGWCGFLSVRVSGLRPSPVVPPCGISVVVRASSRSEGRRWCCVGCETLRMASIGSRSALVCGTRWRALPKAGGDLCESWPRSYAWVRRTSCVGGSRDGMGATVGRVARNDADHRAGLIVFSDCVPVCLPVLVMVGLRELLDHGSHGREQLG